MFKQERVEPNLSVSKLNRWVQAEDEDSNLLFGEYIGVQGPERCGAALLNHVFMIFGWQSGIPNTIVMFLELKTLKRQDSWLLLDLKEAIHKERIQAYVFRELLMSQNGGWNTRGWNDSSWVVNMRLYQKGRAFCHRCGEKADLSSLCEFAVCKDCWHSGRRLKFIEDEGLRSGSDAKYGPLTFYLGNFTCIMVDENPNVVRKVGLKAINY